MNNLNLILPEIFISLSIMFLLILGVFKKNSSSVVHNLSIGFLLITGILIINNSTDSVVTLFDKSYVIDNLSFMMKILTITGGVFVLLIGVLIRDFLCSAYSSRVRLFLSYREQTSRALAGAH